MIAVTVHHELPRNAVRKARAHGLNHSRAVVRKNEVLLRKKLKITFATLAARLSEYVVHHYGATHKATNKDTIPKEATQSIISQISQDDWDNMSEEMRSYLTAVAASGATLTADMIAGLGYSVDDQLAIQNAVLWAEHRSAEMLGRRSVAGELIDNPNAKWAIDQGTRDLLSATIDSAIADGSTVSELAQTIMDSYAFSEDRATTIARTEMAYADSQGALASYEQCDAIVGKSWSVDDNPCEICLGNADASPIKLDEDFPSGDDAPPAHPNCECVIVPAFADEM